MLAGILLVVILMTAFLSVAVLGVCMGIAYEVGGAFEISGGHGRRKGFLERISDGWAMF